MPFKIVQTIEEGKLKLVTVPDHWERNGVLYWPGASKQYLRSKESSIVKHEKCLKIQCIVKRKNIPTFHEAEGEIGFMSNHSETETDNENQTPNKIRRLPNKTFNDMAEIASVRMPLAPTKTQSTDYNQSNPPTGKRPFNPDTLNAVTVDSELHNPHSIEVTKEIDLPTININEKDLIFSPVIIEEVLKENVGTVVDTEIEAPTKSILEGMKTIKCEIQTMKNDIQTVTENQTILFNNQNTIIAQISELSIKFEDFIKLSLTKKTNTTPGISDTRKIHNRKTLEEFEGKIDEPDFRNEVYRQYSVLLTQQMPTPLLMLCLQENSSRNVHGPGPQKEMSQKCALKVLLEL